MDFLIRITREQPDVAIVCMAPLANLAAACRKDPTFPERVGNLVVLGGTYLAQGNTDLFCSEYNFFKDPDSAQFVFDHFPSITLVPLESTFFQRMLPLEVNLKPYKQVHTAKGKMVMDSFRVAYTNMMDTYETCDPIAVAVAVLGDEIVQEMVCKPCYIETEG